LLRSFSILKSLTIANMLLRCDLGLYFCHSSRGFEPVLQHKVGYFRRLMTTNKEIDDSIRLLLRISRENIERCQKTDYVPWSATRC